MECSLILILHCCDTVGCASENRCVCCLVNEVQQFATSLTSMGNHMRLAVELHAIIRSGSVCLRHCDVATDSGRV